MNLLEYWVLENFTALGMVVEETVHLLAPSRENVSRSNIPSQERLERFPMENGECFSHTKLPESRRRRVSAVRDFPLGCGPYDQLSSLRPVKEVASVGIPNEEVATALLDRNCFSPPDGSTSVSNDNDPEKIPDKMYPRGSVVEAVGDFPTFCGVNASLEARTLGQKKSVMGYKPSSLNTVKTDVKQTGIGDRVQPNTEEKIHREKPFDISHSPNHLHEEDFESSRLPLDKLVVLDSDQLQVSMGDKPSSSNTAKTTVKEPGVNLQNEEFLKECDHSIEMRKKVSGALRLFSVVFESLEDEKSEEGSAPKRVDLKAAKILKKEGRFVNTGKQIIGPVPGVEVGDECKYRVELTIIGLHRQTRAGIDFVMHGGRILATSIVASGSYEDKISNEMSIIYTGQGGNYMLPRKKAYDQKLKRGNLALKNSLDEQNPIRLIHRLYSSDGQRKYVYKGLFVVTKCFRKRGTRGKLVWEFHLRLLL
ncbi:histone-lysine N-methyltransferase, H3 lysine-9 specific SUVH6-like isoform X3 [Rosa rugosa]|uniref:histone-lysine N-methyltransferase, H3 lysine-9 specific SUVH6-like isoform X3 n=1 Tax=Rosa rugosa TaxID=74645 RepID=UPI002B414E1C|nr:histone-lysine N-methyltransferase, H3 lysine-9 specific SUVH6-like isoform X3 [Rosa rugosa]